MRFIYSAILLVVVLCSAAQQKANYQLASRFSPKKLEKLIFSTTIDPHWLKKGDKFWYMYETSEGKNWYIVDAAKGEKKLLWDNEKLAMQITEIVKDPFDAKHLGLDSMRFVNDETAVQFEVKSSIEIEKKDSVTKKTTKEKKTFYLEYNLLTQELKELVDFKKTKRKPNWASVSPNFQTFVFGKKHNLYMMDKANYDKALLNEDDSTIVETQLTFDGVENFAYHGDGVFGGGGETNVDKEKNKNKRKPAFIYWSPDGNYFTMVKTDVRKVKELWVINSIADPRPTLETYKYWMPGEKESPTDYVVLYNMQTKTSQVIAANQFKDQDISLWNSPSLASTRDDDFRPLIWHGTNTHFFFERTSRDLKKIDVCSVDVATGNVKSLIEERLNTYVEIIRPGLVKNTGEIIQWSERNGWGHFYLYDKDGKLKNAITNGAYHCENIIGIDEKKRVLYFTANGREYVNDFSKKGNSEKEDPYYLHFYKVNLDGTNLQLLNAGNYDYAVNMNDNNSFFVNTFSRVNTIPKSELITTDGKKVMDLETADFTNLLQTGYKFPEPFKAKADDGITDLFGVMYKPFDFDPTKKYPIIEYVYPGPQTEAVNKSFGRGFDRIDRLAQLGFIVITVGNRGGHPALSKWYHNYGYGNLRDYGLADKKAVIEQLADRFTFIDRNKVGIHGHSGGGFMSTAAMLVYPDIFKVAVSSAGNHDNSIYNRWWSEKHHGVKETISEKNDTTFAYSIDKNPDVVKNLKGHLLLVHGEIDNNVHPANTMRVVNALIKANKRFDMLILPTQRHGFGDMQEYWFWKAADYFSKYLMGDDTERSVDIEEINREVERKK